MQQHDRRLDRRGYYRSPVTLPEHRIGKRPANAGRKFPPEPLSRDEVNAILSECGSGDPGARDRAAFTIMYRAGLRIAEVLALLPKDVDTGGGLVHVLHGKGDRARVVPIDPAAVALIDVWLAHRRELGLDGQQPLICTIMRPNRGDRCWDSVLREKLKDCGRRAGIAKRVAPHGLRHTYATELAREGVPMNAIRQLLGHKRLAYTEGYINELYPAELARWIHARKWEPPSAHAAS